MGDRLAGPELHDLPPRTWELTRARAWAAAGAGALGIFGVLLSSTLVVQTPQPLVAAWRCLVGGSALLGCALLVKAVSDALRVRALRRDCVAAGCSAWTGARTVMETTERRRSMLVRRGLPWYEIQSGLRSSADSSNYAVVLLLAFGVSRYGLRGAIEARLEQELTEAGTGTPYVARVVVERWPARLSLIELRFWLALVAESPRGHGLLPSAATLLDVIRPRSVVNDREAPDTFVVEFEIPPNAPPGDVLADPPVYWALVMEGGEEPFVFRSVFSAALCRFDDAAINS